MTAEQIESLLPWRKPREINTKYGPRILRKCDPTEEFWTLWRTANRDLKDLGVTLSQFQGKWEVNWWRKIDEKILAERHNNELSSRSDTSEIEIPCPNGLSYMNFQRAGIAFSIGKKAVLFGDSMGLGKSCQALASAVLNEAFPLLTICPAGLKLNWQNEIEKFYPGIEVVIVNANRKPGETLRALWERVRTSEVQPTPEVLRDSVRKLVRCWEGSGKDSCGACDQDMHDVRETDDSPAVLGEDQKVLRTFLRDKAQKHRNGASDLYEDKTSGTCEEARSASQVPSRLDRSPDNSRSDSSQCVGERMEVEPYSSNRKWYEDIRVSTEVHNRPCASEEVSSCRGGWGQSQADKAEGVGQEEASVPRIERMVCNQGEEQGGNRKLKGRCGPHIVICSYELLPTWIEEFSGAGFKGIIIDELHFCKSRTARRSKLVKQIADSIPVKYGLTGTALLNRPSELWMQLSILAPEMFPKFFPFAKKYCDAHHNGFGWDYNGSSNLDELRTVLRQSGVFIRRLKSEVLKDLPPKRRQVIVLSSSHCASEIEDENQVFDKHRNSIESAYVSLELAKAGNDDQAYREAVEKLQVVSRTAFNDVSKVRLQVALAKVDQSIDHIKLLLEGGVERLVVFGHHTDVIESVRAGLSEYGVECITGNTPQSHRKGIVDRFNLGTGPRVLILSLYAAGVGLSVKASVEVFVELDWVPGIIAQCEDRCHGFGRGTEGEPLLVHHLVLDKSLDAKVMHTIVEKMQLLDQALDKGQSLEVENPILPVHYYGGRKQAYRDEAAGITDTQIDLIHSGLMTLAGMCDGARQIDGHGFNKIDARIGHSLAHQPRLTPTQAALGRRILRKYGRQLGQELIESIV